MAAENYLGMGLLHRTRHRIDPAEVDETAVILGLLHAPERDHRGEKFLAARAFMIERRADRIELGLEVAHSDAEDEAAVRQHIHRRQFLGEYNRIALWQYDDAGAKLHAFGMRGDKRQGDRTIDEGSIGRNGRRRRLRLGQHDMLSRPEALEAGLLCGARDGCSNRRISARTEIDAE